MVFFINELGVREEIEKRRESEGGEVIRRKKVLHYLLPCGDARERVRKHSCHRTSSKNGEKDVSEQMELRR